MSDDHHSQYADDASLIPTTSNKSSPNTEAARSPYPPTPSIVTEHFPRRWMNMVEKIGDGLFGEVCWKCKQEQENPQIVGLRSPMSQAKILADKHNANALNSLVHLQLLCVQRGKELGFCWRV